MSQGQIPQLPAANGHQQLIPQTHPGQAQPGSNSQLQVQHIPTNIISGTYINSNIIVHHQKTKSSSSGSTGVRRQSASKHGQNAQKLISQRHALNNTVNGHYPGQAPGQGGLPLAGSQAHRATQPQVNKVNGSNLISASGGVSSHVDTKKRFLVSLVRDSGQHMRGGSYNVQDRSFHSTHQL